MSLEPTEPTTGVMRTIANSVFKNGLMGLCGVTVLAAFLFLLYAAVYVDMKNEQVVNLLTGLVTGVVTTMISFYFGTSSSSVRKTEIMAEKMKTDV